MQFTPEFDKMISASRDEAQRTGHRRILPEHILIALLRSPGKDVEDVFEALGTDREALRKEIDGMLRRQDAIPYSELDSIHLSEEAGNAVSYSAAQASIAGTEEVGAVHLLAGACKAVAKPCRSLLERYGISVEAVRKASRKEGTNPKVVSEPGTPLALDIAEAIEAEIRKSLKENTFESNISS